MKKYVYDKAINQRFFSVRQELKKSQDFMGKEMGVSGSHYSKIELGECKVKKSTALALCYAFDVSYEYLVFGKEPMFVHEDENRKQLNTLYDELADPARKLLLDFIAFLKENTIN